MLRFRRVPERLVSSTDGVTVGLCLLVVVASVLTGVGVQTASATTQRLDNCTTITEPGTYELTTDVVTQQGIGDACIRVEASGVVFDGGGHTIRGNGTGTGIGVGDCCSKGPDDVVVRDLEVVHFADGITSFEVSHLRIRDVKVVWSDSTGMSGGDGINLFHGTDLVVENSTVVNAEAWAVQISGSDVVVRNNWFVNNDGGLNAHGANHLIAGNLVENTDWRSVWAYGHGNHTVRNNTVVNGTRSGITVNNASEVVNNVVRNNSQAGIEVGRNSVVTGNRVLDNGEGGILIDGGRNLIYDNYLENERNIVGPEGESPTGGATWNIDPQSGTNVVGGSVVGGNFWAEPDGAGYSQTCTDVDANGVCDDPYSVPGLPQTDNYPLADPPKEESSETTTTTTTTEETTATATTEETTATTTSTTTTTVETATTTTETTTAMTETTTATTETTTQTTTATSTTTTTVEETTTATTQTTAAPSSDSDDSASDSGSAVADKSTSSDASGSQTDDVTTTTATQTPTTTTVIPTSTTTTQTPTTETTQTAKTTSETVTANTTTATATTLEDTPTEQPTQTTPVTVDEESATTATTESAPFSSVETPGFGFIAALLALLGGAVLALRQG